MSGALALRLETLKRARDFDRVFRAGRSVQGREMSLLIYRKREPGPRVGFCVSKKLGPAVTRNRVRRRLREVCRGQLTNLSPRWDLVILAKPAAVTASFQQLQKTFEELLAKAGNQQPQKSTPPVSSAPSVAG